MIYDGLVASCMIIINHGIPNQGASLCPSGYQRFLRNKALLPPYYDYYHFNIPDLHRSLFSDLARDRYMFSGNYFG
ncbi:hypothetical protein GYH30_011442 [Glycine max]|uniref:Uncharacterized protein n=1 Tax=Glycine max TaxID=3847 RepID=K7KMM7_SOYBN|nr:hypothetical protein GYH30_011442 [Glycine max]